MEVPINSKRSVVSIVMVIDFNESNYDFIVKNYVKVAGVVLLNSMAERREIHVVEQERWLIGN